MLPAVPVSMSVQTGNHLRLQQVIKVSVTGIAEGDNCLLYWGKAPMFGNMPFQSAVNVLSIDKYGQV